MRTFPEARTGFIVTEHHGRGKSPPGRFLASTIDVSAGKFTDTRFTSPTKPLGSAFAAAGMSAIYRPIRPVATVRHLRERRPNCASGPPPALPKPATTARSSTAPAPIARARTLTPFACLCRLCDYARHGRHHAITRLLRRTALNSTPVRLLSRGMRSRSPVSRDLREIGVPRPPTLRAARCSATGIRARAIRVTCGRGPSLTVRNQHGAAQTWRSRSTGPAGGCRHPRDDTIFATARP